MLILLYMILRIVFVQYMLMENSVTNIPSRCVEMRADQIGAYFLGGISRGIYYTDSSKVYRRRQTTATLRRVSIQAPVIRHYRSQRSRIGARCRDRRNLPTLSRAL